MLIFAALALSPAPFLFAYIPPDKPYRKPSPPGNSSSVKRRPIIDVALQAAPPVEIDPAANIAHAALRPRGQAKKGDVIVFANLYNRRVLFHGTTFWLS